MADFPRHYRDVIQLADWLEITAIEAADKNSSVGDLRNALSFHIENPERVELKSLEVMQEITMRERAAGDSYPFSIVEDRVLQTKPNWQEFVGYIFCLVLSYYGWKSVRGAPINPWFLFEDLCRYSLQHYLQGEVIQFGKRKRGRTFANAIDDLCDRIGEGGGFREQDLRSVNDDRVDLIAWREFEDKRSSKIVIFGQCAAGQTDWVTKLPQMQPSEFWRTWIRDGYINRPIRSFYIPHRVPQNLWDRRARGGGILFDRCRVSYWAYFSNDELIADERYLTWAQGKLNIE